MGQLHVMVKGGAEWQAQQDDLGTAASWTCIIKLKGDIWTDHANQFDGGAAFELRQDSPTDNSQRKFLVTTENRGAGTYRIYAIFYRSTAAESALVFDFTGIAAGDDLYLLLSHDTADSNRARCKLVASDRSTIIAEQTATDATANNTGAALGKFRVVPQATGTIDGIVFYNTVVALPPANPAGDDTGVIAMWAMEEASGGTAANETAGGTALAVEAGATEDIDFEWIAGGAWDGGGGSSPTFKAAFARGSNMVLGRGTA